MGIKSITLVSAALPTNQLRYPTCLPFPFSLLSNHSWSLVANQAEQLRCWDREQTKRDSQPPTVWVSPGSWGKAGAAKSRLTTVLAAPAWTVRPEHWAPPSVAILYTPPSLPPVSFSTVRQSFPNTRETALLPLKPDSKGRKGSNWAPQHLTVASTPLRCPFLLFGVRMPLHWNKHREVLRSQFLPNALFRVFWVPGQSLSGVLQLGWENHATFFVIFLSPIHTFIIQIIVNNYLIDVKGKMESSAFLELFWEL